MSMNMIKKVIYSIQNNEAILDKELVFYVNDGTIDLEIVLNKIDYSADKYKINILTPDNEVIESFPELVCMDADKNLYLPYEFNANNLPGKYKMQITLMKEFNYLNLPEFEFEIKENITGLDGTETIINTKTIIGECVVRDGGTSRESGYISEQWYSGDVITTDKMNNMVNGINEGIESAEIAVNSAQSANTNAAAANGKATEALTKADSANTNAAAAVNGLSGKANIGHTHTKTDITDFPTKLSEFQNDIGAGGGGGSGTDGHTHANINALNSITDFKIAQWDDKPTRYEHTELYNYAHEIEDMALNNNTLIEQTNSQLEDITQQLENVIVSDESSEDVSVSLSSNYGKNFRIPTLKPFLFANNPIITKNMVTDKTGVSGVADPFIVKENGVYYCFFELCTGSVSSSEVAYAYSYDAISWTYGKKITTETRAAFPNIFKYKEEWYMIPDTSANLDVYKTYSFPEGWNKITTLMNGKFADTDIVNISGIWYLFTLDVNTNANAISVFYNESGEWNNTSWTRHPQSPIISKNGARLGGKIIKNEDGSIILPVQGTVSGQYGEKTEYYQITNLSKTSISISNGVVAMTGLQGDDWTKLAVHQIDMLSLDNGNLYVIDGLFASGEQYAIGLYTDGEKDIFATASITNTTLTANTWTNATLVKMYDSDFMISNNAITVPYNGYYQITTQSDVDKIKVNINSITKYVTICGFGHKILKLNKGDVINIQLYTSATTMQNNYDTSFVEVIRV